MALGPVITVGGNPTDIAGLPASTTAYVSGGDSVTPTRPGKPQPGTAIDVGTTAEAVALAPDGNSAWVSGGDGTLVHVDLQHRPVIGRVKVGGQPRPW